MLDDAGAVDQHVQPGVLPQPCLDGVAVAHIERLEGDAGIRSVGLGGPHFSSGGTRGRDIGAGGNKRAGDGGANPAGATGDENIA